MRELNSSIHTSIDANGRNYMYLTVSDPTNEYRYAKITNYNREARSVEITLSKKQEVGSIQIFLQDRGWVLKVGIKRNFESRLTKTTGRLVHSICVEPIDDNQATAIVYLDQKIASTMVPHDYRYVATRIVEKRVFGERNPEHSKPIIEEPTILPKEEQSDFVFVSSDQLAIILEVMEANKLKTLRLPHTSVSITE